MKKKGVSPIIATLLLVGLVIAAGVVTYLWFKSLSKEAVTKFGDKNIELVCGEVDFEASYSSGVLYVSNMGNVPLYSMKIKKYEGGGYETDDVREVPGSNWPGSGLAQGQISTQPADYSGLSKVIVVPVLAGNSKKGSKIVKCSDENGIEIQV